MGFRQWTRRPKGAEVPHTGHAWLTDGKQVWLVYSTGFAAQFMAADAVTHWMQAEMPAPPVAADATEAHHPLSDAQLEILRRPVVEDVTLKGVQLTDVAKEAIFDLLREERAPLGYKDPPP